MSTLRTALCATVCLVALAACGGGSEPAAPPAAPPPSSESATHDGAHAGGAVTGSLDAADQTSDGESVTIAAVEIQSPNGGWIALHQDADGKPGPVEHVVAVPAGASTDVVLPTPGGITTGAYWPMLHVDDGAAGTYEFPGADVPVTDGGKPVMKQITVTVS